MRKTIGKLNCLVRPGAEPGNDVVILHGFGADASDLFPLAGYLDPEENWNFYFPDAPIEVPLGGHFVGRGWFPISVRELETGVDFAQVRPPGLDQSSEAVSDLLFHLNSKRLVLGGFSQGAMISMEVALSQPDDIAGLILWSGAVLDEPGWTRKLQGLKGKRYVQSHGMSDSVIGFSIGQRLN
jgi:phospholipase/carboxylesterase